MKETIIGIIFMVIFISILVIWGNSKNIKPDISNDVNKTSDPCYINGHPLWSDC